MADNTKSTAKELQSSVAVHAGAQLGRLLIGAMTRGRIKPSVAQTVGMGFGMDLGEKLLTTPAKAAEPAKPPVTPEKPQNGSPAGNLSEASFWALLTGGNIATAKAGVEIIAGSGNLKSALARGAAKLLGGTLTVAGGGAAITTGGLALGSMSKATGGQPAAPPPSSYLNDAAKAKAAAAPDQGGQRPAAAAPATGSGPVEVPGYTRDDGVVVKGYTRQRQ